MKYLLRILFFLLPVITIGQQSGETWSRVRIDLAGKSIETLAQTGIDVTEGYLRKGAYLETDLSSSEIQAVEAAGFDVQTLIADVSAFYAQRAQAEADIPILRNPGDEFPVPQNWGYGSMGGFYTYQQVLEKLDFMAATWPNLITARQAISPFQPSIEGNPIWWVKISNNPNVNEDKPKVLYTSLIHAREGIGVQQMIYFMLWLLENYQTNPMATLIVDNFQLYFVPVVNPDGYLFNEANSPQGGGMWRKNRRNNGGSFGVDINRNFGYKWGLDNSGSSPTPSSETYRGTGPFSEPETTNLKIFCETHDFKIALNYHSYSNLLLWPWGYTSDLTPDQNTFAAFAALMTRDNNYTMGPANTTIYATNGSSDDYMYGDTVGKNAIFAYTPEVGSASDGFWPAISRIIPLCQENMIQNVYAALLSGPYANVSDRTDAIVGTKDFYFKFDIQRLGLTNASQFTVSVQPLDGNLIQHGQPRVFNGLAHMQTITDSIAMTLAPEITSGTVFRFLLSVNNGLYTKTDTITKRYGVTSVIFSDNCSSMQNWSATGTWGLTTQSFISAPTSITDSPGGNYQGNQNTSITLSQPVSIPNTTYARLNFWARWNIEAGWDYTQVLIRPTNSFNWIPLQGKYTKPGGSNQLPGQPLYDGISDWVLEDIDLTPWAGKDVLLRFTFRSDGAVNADGFYFDDIKITVLDVETSAEAAQEPRNVRIFPNPARNTTNVVFDRPVEKQMRLELINQSGQMVRAWKVEAGTRRIELDLSALSPGIYQLLSPQGELRHRIVVE
ncbi:MAG: immune inhibitor A [Bacteroidetes bacterium]|nr:immune inhibitor A [Bacteroidota bacterium]